MDFLHIVIKLIVTYTHTSILVVYNRLAEIGIVDAEISRSHSSMHHLLGLELLVL